MININCLDIVVSYIKDQKFKNRVESKILYRLLIIEQQRYLEIVNINIIY